MQIIILKSEDGPDYTQAVLAPDSMDHLTDEELDWKIETALNRGKAKGGVEWDWGDLITPLNEEGFLTPDVHDGGVWDSEIPEPFVIDGESYTEQDSDFLEERGLIERCSAHDDQCPHDYHILEGYTSADLKAALEKRGPNGT